MREIIENPGLRSIEGFGMRREGKLVLWPEYFDSDYSRRSGRRVPKTLASRNVMAEEVYQAALELGLNPDLQVDAANPKHPWLRKGMVLVDKKGPKTRVVLDLARKMSENRREK